MTPEQKAAYRRAWRKANPEKMRGQAARQKNRRRKWLVGWRLRNADKLRRQAREYYHKKHDHLPRKPRTLSPTKTCSLCKQVKPRDEFYGQTGKTSSRCKPCLAKHFTAWRKANPKDWKLYHRRSRLKRHYGLSLEEYDQMVVNQSGLCAICRNENNVRGRRLNIDHHHASGVVRGLLCNSCNRGIGYFVDNPDTLRAAATYLEERCPSKKEKLA